MTCPWASCVHMLRRVVICWFNTCSCSILSLKEVTRALISLTVVEPYNCSSSAYHQCNHRRVSAHKQIKEDQDSHQLLALLPLFLMSLLLLFSSLSCLCALCIGWCLARRACNHLMGLNLLDGRPTVLNELPELVLLVIMNAVLTLKLFLCNLLLWHLERLYGCAWIAC